MAVNREKERALTGSMLEKLFTYDPETGIFTAIKKRARQVASKRVGSNSHGYLEIGINGYHYKTHRLAWVWMTGKWPPQGMEIDHINRNRADNRISNLRLVNHSQNMHNGGLHRTNKTGCRGVWHEKRKNHSPRWVAYITVNDKQIRLGSHKTKEQAVRVRKIMENANAAIARILHARTA